MPIAILVMVMASTVLTDSDTRCRTDSGGHRICADRDRETKRVCTTTCRRDSGGNLVCKERCR